MVIVRMESATDFRAFESGVPFGRTWPANPLILANDNQTFSHISLSNFAAARKDNISRQKPNGPQRTGPRTEKLWGRLYMQTVVTRNPTQMDTNKNTKYKKRENNLVIFASDNELDGPFIRTVSSVSRVSSCRFEAAHTALTRLSRHRMHFYLLPWTPRLDISWKTAGSSHRSRPTNDISRNYHPASLWGTQVSRKGSRVSFSEDPTFCDVRPHVERADGFRMGKRFLQVPKLMTRARGRGRGALEKGHIHSREADIEKNR
ncbi:hypothetical protein PM082_000353 [Marasmius tenuissimus]|nr:hypothetical protein PM082_000353 [Marasmius tenuissimus]